MRPASRPRVIDAVPVYGYNNYYYYYRAGKGLIRKTRVLLTGNNGGGEIPHPRGELLDITSRTQILFYLWPRNSFKLGSDCKLCTRVLFNTLCSNSLFASSSRATAVCLILRTVVSQYTAAKTPLTQKNSGRNVTVSGRY